VVNAVEMVAWQSLAHEFQPTNSVPREPRKQMLKDQAREEATFTAEPVC
jgi:hypothetical protein